MRSLSTIVFVLFSLITGAQLPNPSICTNPGQTPGTAFPVCGTSTFLQNSVPLCGGRSIPAPTCTENFITDINPYWYKFTCFKSGTLGFSITPLINAEDYDWQLFDVTNQPPDAVFTNDKLIVAYNWSGEFGQTGASPAGNSVFVCGGGGRPLWSKMPNLVEGHQYLLLISHFTQTQSGYNLSFLGGTAVITDSTQPKLNYAEASCGGQTIRAKLNKKMKCSSLAADGSDFYIMPGNIPLLSAIGIGCNNGFDMDSVELKLSSVLAPGNYSLHVKAGSDGNTLLDYCDKSLPLSEVAGFTVTPIAPTPMDSIAPVSCNPNLVRLVFSKPVLCTSVAPDGSDFTITGPYPVTIKSAKGSCLNTSLTKEILVELSQNLSSAGSFTITLKNGTDGNTLLDECTMQTPAGSNVSFNVGDTVNADFTYLKFYGCSLDTVNFFHPGLNGVNNWKWNLDDNKSSTLQSPQALYSQFDQKNIQLIVSNGFCADTSAQSLMLDNFLKADFNVFPDNCPNEPTSFTSEAKGFVVRHDWSFGDGGVSLQPSPTHSFAPPLRVVTFQVNYTVTDSFGCTSTIQKPVKIYSSCLLAVPSAFTPNKDGLNDLLYPLNAVKAEKLDFKVFNRWGQLVFRSSNWKLGWDGTFKGIPLASDVFVWYLSYVDRDTKEPRQMKGTAMLIR